MNIIVVFPKIEHAKSVRSILLKSGYTVDAVCSSGAQALRAANDLDSGIIICSFRLSDMVYSELHEYLAPRFDMLLIGSQNQIRERETEDIVTLGTPLKVHELLQTVAMMAEMSVRKKKKRKQKPKVRSEQEKRTMNQAKLLLMERNHFSEEEAHRYLQKRSMENGAGLAETAQMIISLIGSEM